MGAGSPRGCGERSPGSTRGSAGRQRPTGTEAPPAKTPTRPEGDREDLIAKWGGPSRLREGAGCAVRVTRQYLFCLREDADSLRAPRRAHPPPPAWSAPNIAPPAAATRGDRAGERRLLVPVCGRCRRRCDEAFVFLPTRLGGMAVLASQYARVAGGLGDRDRLPPTRQASPPLKQHTCCAQRAPRTGAKQRSRTLGRPPLRLVAVPGGRRRSCSAAEATAAAAAVVQQCCCWALFF